MVSYVRARKDEQKEERRGGILAVARQLAGSSPFASITMSQVAEQAGLAKGTLYLYFKTKEELILALLEEELDVWFALVDDRIEHLRKPDADAVATLLCRSLDERPLFVRLLAILHALLEQNLAPESTLRFKRTLLHRVGTTAFRLESALPFLSPGGGSELLLTLHAMVVGFRQMADPSPVVAQVLALDEMAPLRTDFASSIERALRALLLGMSHRSRTRRNP
jgi:AcrR family transcriptional regulator